MAVVGPGDDEPARGQRRDARAELIGAEGRVDQEFAAELVAAGVEQLRLDAEAARVGALRGTVAPDHDEAAARQQRQRAANLVVERLGVDQDVWALALV